MADKKVMITLPEDLLSKIDSLATKEKKARDDYITAALQRYVDAVDLLRKAQLRQELIKGYMEMAPLELEIAEDALETDNQIWPDS